MTVDKKEYLDRYRKEKLKRVPLDVPIDLYEDFKRYADATGTTVNGLLKRMMRNCVINNRGHMNDNRNLFGGD